MEHMIIRGNSSLGLHKTQPTHNHGQLGLGIVWKDYQLLGTGLQWTLDLEVYEFGSNYNLKYQMRHKLVVNSLVVVWKLLNSVLLMEIFILFLNEYIYKMSI